MDRPRRIAVQATFVLILFLVPGSHFTAMISAELLNVLEEGLSRKQGVKIAINQVQPVRGGDINLAYRLSGNGRDYFLKLNSGVRIADLFEKEAFGLELLARSSPLRVPTPLLSGSFGPTFFLVMEWISKGEVTRNFWEVFARGLVRLHRNTQAEFGLDQDNFIGSLPQSNKPCRGWPEFFWSRRLEPLLRMAVDLGRLAKKYGRNSQKPCDYLGDLIPAEPPALLHGDLWAGNFICDERGNPCFYDPAVYFGHREMDLAMTLLFGGFHRSFYLHYQEVHPLEPGWEKRLECFQLYPLLVHAVLFGGSYPRRVEEILDRWKVF